MGLQNDFPRAHDLDLLGNLLPNDWQTKEKFPDLATLTEWAVESRYPGDWPEATETDAKMAIEQAQQILALLERDLKQHLNALIE